MAEDSLFAEASLLLEADTDGAGVGEKSPKKRIEKRNDLGPLLGEDAGSRPAEENEGMSPRPAEKASKPTRFKKKTVLKSNAASGERIESVQEPGGSGESVSPPDLASVSQEEHEALLAVHRRAIQKVIQDNCEKVLEAIMQHTSTLQAAAMKGAPSLNKALVQQARDLGEPSGPAFPSLRASHHTHLCKTAATGALGLGHLGGAHHGEEHPHKGLFGAADFINERAHKLAEKVHHELHDNKGDDPGHKHIARDLYLMESAKTGEENQENPASSSLPSSQMQEMIFEMKKPKGLFADADDMKEQLRAAILQPTYDVCNFYHDEGRAQAVARSVWFEHLTLAVICVNAIWIAIDVDLNDAGTLNDAELPFIIADNLFCSYFSWEVILRFCAFKTKLDVLRDSWFVFDSFLAFLMIFETWFVPLVIVWFSEDGSADTFFDASLLKIFRLVRLVRMARVLRLLNAMPELMVLIKGMKVAFRAVTCTVALMLMIIYVFSVLFRQITSDTHTGRTHFYSVPVTMRYLLLQGCMPDVFESIAEIWDDNDLFALIFVFFVLIVSITVMNMLVGVLVGVINTITAVEKEQLMIHFVKENLLELMETVCLDQDNDGKITRAEFDRLIQVPAAIRSFDQMGVDVVGLVDLADFIFKDDAVELSFEDFIELVLQLRGSNQATVKDIVDLRKCVTLEMVQLRSDLSQWNHALTTGTKLKELEAPPANVMTISPAKNGISGQYVQMSRKSTSNLEDRQSTSRQSSKEQVRNSAQDKTLDQPETIEEEDEGQRSVQLEVAASGQDEEKKETQDEGQSKQEGPCCFSRRNCRNDPLRTVRGTGVAQCTVLSSNAIKSS